MGSKILSFICHVPGVIPGAYPAVPTTSSTSSTAPKAAAERRHDSVESGHFTAIYENDKFIRFKYISNG